MDSKATDAEADETIAITTNPFEAVQNDQKDKTLNY